MIGSDAVDYTSGTGEARGPEGTAPGALEHHAQPDTTLAFAGRGMRLASGARDGGGGVSSLKKNGTGKLVGSSSVSDVVTQLYWRPDGRVLAALDGRGGVTAWRIRT